MPFGDVDAAADRFIPALDKVMTHEAALKSYYASKAWRDDGLARGKAEGALAMGIGARAIAKMAAERPAFVAAATHAVGGSLVPVPGGVLILDRGEVVGAVGISGDLSDNDEICAVAGIEAAGLKADTGA